MLDRYLSDYFLFVLKGIVLNEGFDFIFDAQRLKHAMEYVNAISTRKDRYGVLFSGPNGVGNKKIIPFICAASLKITN